MWKLGRSESHLEEERIDQLERCKEFILLINSFDFLYLIKKKKIYNKYCYLTFLKLNRNEHHVFCFYYKPTDQPGIDYLYKQKWPPYSKGTIYNFSLTFTS